MSQSRKAAVGPSNLPEPARKPPPCEPPVSTDSTYHILYAGRWHGVQIVADGKSIAHTLDDPVDYEIRAEQGVQGTLDL